MAGDWLGDVTRWLGPPRGGGKGNRQAQSQRQAAKRKLARAAAREARETAGKVAGKRGPKVKTVWWKRRLIGKQTPLDARATMTLAKKEAAAKAAALELEKEAALQDARAATRLVASAEKRVADALNYAHMAWNRTDFKGPPFLG